MGKTRWRKSPGEWHVMSKTRQEDLSLTFLPCLLSLAAFLGRGKGRVGLYLPSEDGVGRRGFSRQRDSESAVPAAEHGKAVLPLTWEKMESSRTNAPHPSPPSTWPD